MPIIIWKSLNKKTPPNYPQCFCRCCSEALECLCFHFHQQKTTDGCVLLGQHKASETSVSNCPSVLTSPSSCRKGVCDLTLFFLNYYFWRFVCYMGMCGLSLLPRVPHFPPVLAALLVWVLCTLLPQILFETFAFCCVTGSFPLGIFPLLECWWEPVPVLSWWNWCIWKLYIYFLFQVLVIKGLNSFTWCCSTQFSVLPFSAFP